MNFYQFLKGVQEGVGDGCVVATRLWKFWSVVEGVEVRIIWPNDFRYQFVLPEQSIDNEGFLEHFCRYTVEKARREFRIAEVGED